MILAQQVQCTVGWSDFEENTLHDVHNECRTPIPKFHFYLFISYLHLSLLQYVQSSFFLSFSFSLVYLLISLVNCLSHYIILFSSLSFFSYFQILLFLSLFMSLSLLAICFPVYLYIALTSCFLSTSVFLFCLPHLLFLATCPLGDLSLYFFYSYLSTLFL